MHGRLTERLLAQGLLTPSMVQELKTEWDKSSKRHSDSDDDQRPFKPLRRTKRTKDRKN